MKQISRGGAFVGKPAEIRLSPKAIATLNEILSRGKEVEIAVRNGRLVIWETSSHKKYEVAIA